MSSVLTLITPYDRILQQPRRFYAECRRSNTLSEMRWLLLIAFIRCNSNASEVTDVVHALNARFRAGSPSDDPALAGVAVHALDDRDRQLIKQLSYGGSLWRPNGRNQNGSGTTGEIVSCSIMNAQLPFLFVQAREGFVLRPSAVRRALMCAFPYDADTNKVLCPADWRSSDTCVPGCFSMANQRLLRNVGAALQCSQNVSRCKPAGRRNSSFLSRQRLSLSQAMLLQWHEAQRRRVDIDGQYNELVLAADTLASLLPSAIEAVYTWPRTVLTDAQVSCAKAHLEAKHVFGCRPQGQPSSRVYAVHANLLCHLNRTAQQLPLLELNTSNLVEPFRRAAPLFRWFYGQKPCQKLAATTRLGVKKKIYPN